MRIISGRLGGRLIESPKGHRTHPMSEKMRGALFAALGDITGLTMLDPFAGSGALAFEAVSRGAASATAVDIDRATYQSLRRNRTSLGLEDRVVIVHANASTWAGRNPAAVFDLVACDPPYDRPNLTALHSLAAHVAERGVYILSWPGGKEPLIVNGLREIKRQHYGDGQLVFYRKQI